MASSSDSTRRWVATLIVLLLVLQAGSWLWQRYRRGQAAPRLAAEQAIRRKIAASHAFDNALLRAEALLRQRDAMAAGRLLDSLQRTPTDSLFRIEQQKLQTLLQRLDSIRTAQQTRRPQPAPPTPRLAASSSVARTYSQ